MIIHIIPSYLPNVGGAEVQLSRLARVQASQSIKFLILTRMPQQDEFNDELYVKRLNRHMLFFNLQVFFFLLRNLRSFEVIHVHTLSSVAFTSLVFSRIFNKRTLVKVTRIGKGSQLYLIQKSWIKRKLFKILITENICLIALNKETLKYLDCTFPRVNCSLIPNGISPRKKMVEKGNVLKLVFVSRLIERKRVLKTLQSFSRLRVSNELDYKFTVVGDGPEYKKIQSFLKSSRLDVVLKGNSSENEDQKILNSSHFFIQNSENEGLSNSFLEALNSDVIPVVNPSQFYDEIRKTYPIPLYLEEFIRLSDLSRRKYFDENVRYCEIIIKEKFDIYKVNFRLEKIYGLT